MVGNGERVAYQRNLVRNVFGAHVCDDYVVRCKDYVTSLPLALAKHFHVVLPKAF